MAQWWGGVVSETRSEKMGVEQCGSGFGNYMIVLLLIVTRLLRGDTSTLHNDYEYEYMSTIYKKMHVLFYIPFCYGYMTCISIVTKFRLSKRNPSATFLFLLDLTNVWA